VWRQSAYAIHQLTVMTASAAATLVRISISPFAPPAHTLSLFFPPPPIGEETLRSPASVNMNFLDVCAPDVTPPVYDCIPSLPPSLPPSSSATSPSITLSRAPLLLFVIHFLSPPPPPTRRYFLSVFSPPLFF